MRWLIYDEDSVGYDFRDFEAVRVFVEDNPTDTHFVYTCATHIELFARTLPISRVTYLGYGKGLRRDGDLAAFQQRLGVSEGATLAFDQMHRLVSDRPKLSSGLLIPNGKRYLDVSGELVATYRDALRKIAATYTPLRAVFAVVSGYKPISDVGDTPSAQQLEGRRQTFPLTAVAQVCGTLQTRLLPHGLVFVPLCVQYGARSEIGKMITDANAECRLSFPTMQFQDVDWTDNPHQQAAFYVALQDHARAEGVSTVACGNASTYLHLILAATGGFDAMGIAIHDYEITHPRDGRAYWEELALHLPFIRCIRQSQAGDWRNVIESMQQHLEQALLREDLR